MASPAPLHLSQHRKQFSALSHADRQQLRQLIDTYITTQDPVGEHLAAQQPGSGMMIHDENFLSWHTIFVGRLENWLVSNNGAKFVPLPYWDPATPIPHEINKGNTAPSMPLPAGLRPGPIAAISNYLVLNSEIVPYHNAVHNALGGQMPDPSTSPSDPIFWPFHAFLLAVYEHWRSH